MKKEKTESIKTGVDSTQNQPNTIKPNSRPTRKKLNRMYQIACTFPVLGFKGVENGDIPGILPNGFNDKQLHDFLYNDVGGVWSAGEVLVLEFLLNLYDPYEYKDFNVGRAVNVWDRKQMSACLGAIVKFFNGE